MGGFLLHAHLSRLHLKSLRQREVELAPSFSRSFTGAGYCCRLSRPDLFAHAIITGCSVSFTDSTGIVCYGGGALVENCRVADANWKESDYDSGIVTYYGSTTIRRCRVTRASGTGIRIGALSVGTVLEDNVVKRTQPAAPAAGYGIVCLNGSTVLQGNKGAANAGGFISGQYVNAGGNLGN